MAILGTAQVIFKKQSFMCNFHSTVAKTVTNTEKSPLAPDSAYFSKEM